MREQHEKQKDSQEDSEDSEEELEGLEGFDFDDYSDDETFDDFDTFNSKYQGKNKWFGDKGHSTFRMYKDKYGPFNVRNRKPAEMNSEVEIDLDEMKKEINNNIHTTLSKYFK